jgi:hypothetical protein
MSAFRPWRPNLLQTACFVFAMLYASMLLGMDVLSKPEGKVHSCAHALDRGGACKV